VSCVRLRRTALLKLMMATQPLHIQHYPRPVYANGSTRDRW
jgi:hypothetical protein